jgi:hypothetical protein
MKESIKQILKSKKFQDLFKKRVEDNTWGNGLPMVYLNENDEIVKHWKNGKIEIIKRN